MKILSSPARRQPSRWVKEFINADHKRIKVVYPRIRHFLRLREADNYRRARRSREKRLTLEFVSRNIHWKWSNIWHFQKKLIFVEYATNIYQNHPIPFKELRQRIEVSFLCIKTYGESNRSKGLSLFPATTFRCRLDPGFLPPLTRLTGLFFLAVSVGVL